MAMLLLLSSNPNLQWSCWQSVRALATHVVVSAEAAQAVAQHGRGLVQLPPDMVQTLDVYFKEVGLTGKRAKLRSIALTEQLKALSRSQARGGLQPYRSSSSTQRGSSSSSSVGPAGWQQQQQQQQGGGMTVEQLQEQALMEAELEQMAASFGPEALTRHKRVRAAAAAAAALPLPTTKGGRLKTKAKAALLEHIQVHGSLAVPHEHLRAALDLPPSSSLDSPERNLALKKVTPAYNEGQALAYALARLPGCYAACSRIFSELGARLPGFAPKSLLDFGAGPGTASWAAQEVWPASLTRLTAVEPSLAMKRLGERLEAARRSHTPSAPLVRWRPELPPALQGRRARDGQGAAARADVVVASYVLGEVPHPQQRAALIRHLWSLTSELLVLVEPGTPSGHANILEARDAVLLHETHRAAKLQRRTTAAADASVGSSISLTTEQEQQADSNLSSKLGSKWFGAHVVAPCPHDGRCPLSGPGSKAWCHFGTRFQRPGFMQAAKALPGTHVNPADHQDERYSYVVLRRGVRPAAAVQVDISRSFAPNSSSSSSSNAAHAAAAVAESAEEEELLQPGSSSSSSSSSSSDEDDWQEAAHLQQQQGSRNNSGTELLNMKSSSSSSSSSGITDQTVQQTLHAAYTPQQQQQQQQAPAAAAASSSMGLFTSDEMQQLSALLNSTPLQQQQQQQQQSDMAAAGGSAHFQRVNAKLDVFGAGLVDRLMALENAGLDWAAGHGDGLSQQLAAASAKLQPSADTTAADANSSSSSSSSRFITADSISTSTSSNSSSGSSGRRTLFAAGADDADTADSADDVSSSSGDESEEEVRGEWDETGSDQQQQQQAGVHLQQQQQQQQQQLSHAAAASGSWARIIRPPRKRGGHVILDVCAAAPAADSAADASQPDLTSAAAAAAGRGAHDGWLQPAGRLERHIIAKSDAKKWMGKAAYSMAREAQWGDLWCWRSRASDVPK